MASSQLNPEPPPPSRLKTFTKGLKKAIATKRHYWTRSIELSKSLVSEDAPTRKAALLFFLCVGGILVASTAAVRSFWKRPPPLNTFETQKRDHHLEDVEKKDSEDSKRRGNFLRIGAFTVEFQNPPNYRLTPGQMNMAEVEVVLLCDHHDTRDFMDKHIVLVRNQLTNVFTALDRQEFLSRDGKRKLKNAIIRKLNDWLPHGKVEEVYFSKLLVN